MTTTLKHLKKDLVTTGYESLAKHNEEYKGYAKQGHDIASGLIPVLEQASADSAYQGHKAVVQALFESGFLSTSDSDFNTKQLFNYIYGVKCFQALDSFDSLHKWLTDNDYSDHVGQQEPSDLYIVNGELQCFTCDSTYPNSHGKETGCTNCTSTINQKTWNSSGDNYYSAYSFDHVLSDSERKTIETTSEHCKANTQEERPTYQNRVIVIENQSPMWAIVVDVCPFTGKSSELHIVRLKSSYNDKNRLPELLELVKSNSLKNNYEWSAHTGGASFGIITTLDVRSMECNPVLQPHEIESALFNIYSGVDSIE
jgi:hypothetical protein